MNAHVKPEKIREPEEFEKRVLFLSLGTSPQIITEVIYALTVGREKMGEKQFLPTKVIVLSTTTGVDKARSMLESSDRYESLKKDYDLELPDIEYRWITDNNDVPMDDIRKAADAMHAADCTLRNLRELTEDGDSAVHVSLAGGRKTQGYYTGEATSLFARPQDRLSHVLVSEGYEGNPKFFYPTKNKEMITCRLDGEEVELDANKAEVELAYLPFQRRREQLPAFYLRESGEGLSVILDKLSLIETDFILTVNTNLREICIDGYRVAIDDDEVLAFILMLSVFALKNVEISSDGKRKSIRENGLNLVKCWLVVKGFSLDILDRHVRDDFNFSDLANSIYTKRDKSEEILKEFGLDDSCFDVESFLLPFSSGLVSNNGMSNNKGQMIISEIRKILIENFGPRMATELLPKKKRPKTIEINITPERIKIL